MASLCIHAYRIKILNANPFAVFFFAFFLFVPNRSDHYRKHTVFTRISAAALISFFAPQVRRLFEGSAYLNIVPDKFTFFYIFILQYTFYLLILLWTDAKLIVNLELREKFMR